jgi:hypothetical protein
MNVDRRTDVSKAALDAETSSKALQTKFGSVDTHEEPVHVFFPARMWLLLQ